MRSHRKQKWKGQRMTWTLSGGVLFACLFCIFTMVGPEVTIPRDHPSIVTWKYVFQNSKIYYISAKINKQIKTVLSFHSPLPLSTEFPILVSNSNSFHDFCYDVFFFFFNINSKKWLGICIRGEVAFLAWPLSLARFKCLSRNCLGIGQRMLQLEGTCHDRSILAVRPSFYR